MKLWGVKIRITVFNKFVNRIAETEFVKTAIEEKSDLSAFKEKPTPRILFGVFAICMSYIVGWPAVSFMGVLAIYFRAPLILVIGGPVMYGFSHCVFMVGMYLAGAKYSKIFLKWAARAAVERLLEKIS